MAVDIINKILIFILCLSLLNVIRHSFFLFRSFMNEERFIMDKKSLLFLAMSIAYILMSIFNGVTI